MQKIDAEIGKNGFKYKQVHEGENFYIYEQRIPENGNKIIAYEVFEKKIAKERETEWANMPEREIFPSNEAFGVWAWSMAVKGDNAEKGLARAMERGLEINERIKLRENEQEATT